MWKCKVCDKETDDDSWEICWNCSSPNNISDEEVESLKEHVVVIGESSKKIKCLRCEIPMTFGGTKKFHEGTRQWGFWLGDLGELFVNREEYNIYLCPKCGKVEMYVDTVDEEG